MTFKKLSILMPCFNEEATLAEAVRRVMQNELPNLTLKL